MPAADVIIAAAAAVGELPRIALPRSDPISL